MLTLSCEVVADSRLFEVLGDTEAAAQALREAQRAFAEVEATGHAERLAKELGS